MTKHQKLILTRYTTNMVRKLESGLENPALSPNGRSRSLAALKEAREILIWLHVMVTTD